MYALLQSIRAYPTAYVILLAAVAICVFAWAKALQAGRRRQAKKQALIAVLEHEKKLREEFCDAALTQQKLIDTPPERLVEGLSTNIQLWMERQKDLRAAFDALPTPKRLIYALGYVVQDGREGLGMFFRKNGQPLTGAALEAVKLLTSDVFCALFQKEYDAFDEENETVSLAQEQIDCQDRKFSALKEEQGEALYATAKTYILENSVVFLP
ncbi:MAG: hypothetical protein LBB50_03450 [Oscillospiraceae bacterium]|jgi:hypothetical protein|nr:hypothetical protein [Oscillospiraceae bacterium]